MELNLLKQSSSGLSDAVSDVKSNKRINSHLAQKNKIKKLKISNFEPKSSLKNLSGSVRAPNNSAGLLEGECSMVDKKCFMVDKKFSTPEEAVFEMGTGQTMQKYESETSEEDDESSNVSSCFVRQNNEPEGVDFKNFDTVKSLNRSKFESASFDPTCNSLRSGSIENFSDNNNVVMKFDNTLGNSLFSATFDENCSSSLENSSNIFVYTNNTLNSHLETESVPKFFIHPSPDNLFYSSTFFPFNSHFAAPILLNTSNLNRLNGSTSVEQSLIPKVHSLWELKSLPLTGGFVHGLVKVDDNTWMPTVEPYLPTDDQTKQGVNNADCGTELLQNEKSNTISLRSGKVLPSTFLKNTDKPFETSSTALSSNNEADDRRKREIHAEMKMILPDSRIDINGLNSPIVSRSMDKVKVSPLHKLQNVKVKKRKMKYEMSDKTWSRGGIKNLELKTVVSPMTRSKKKLLQSHVFGSSLNNK
ncbi:hypothetical protein HELRODRAFT_163011 [Helobdella robusta]|uniref:Uncharacterized protein n=1 Tax=Helobdella robusta TaxID=6412 RepID=T1ETK2_HELRO|nr:hypothetical protein HELRODRAFT_163011 [Helobdella robusta]ESN99462.1 hypothetical protein HELRODRAFT_163011 [Helobdella robusta]